MKTVVSLEEIPMLIQECVCVCKEFYVWVFSVWLFFLSKVDKVFVRLCLVLPLSMEKILTKFFPTDVLWSYQ